MMADHKWRSGEELVTTAEIVSRGGLTVRSEAKTVAKRRGCGRNLGLFYAAIPRLSRYSIGLRKPRESLIRFALYQRM